MGLCLRRGQKGNKLAEGGSLEYIFPRLLSIRGSKIDYYRWHSPPDGSAQDELMKKREQSHCYRAFKPGDDR